MRRELKKEICIVVLSLLMIISFYVILRLNENINNRNFELNLISKKDISKESKKYGYYDALKVSYMEGKFEIDNIINDEDNNICNLELSYLGTIRNFYNDIVKLYDGENLISVNNIVIKNMDNYRNNSGTNFFNDNKFSIKLEVAFVKNKK